MHNQNLLSENYNLDAGVGRIVYNLYFLAVQGQKGNELNKMNSDHHFLPIFFIHPDQMDEIMNINTLQAASEQTEIKSQSQPFLY